MTPEGDTPRYSAPRTCKRWTAEDDALVIQHHPDFELLLSLLPERSRHALQLRARGLGIVKKRPQWTTTQARTLRRLKAQGATTSEISRALPGRSPQAIRSRSKAYGYTSPRRLARSDIGILGSVREMAFSRNLTMAELDRLARTGRYFYRGSQRIVVRHVARAAKALGGWVDIEWEPLD